MIPVPLTAGLMFGLAGSLHCMGMCGPLLMALPFETGPTRQKVLRIILYHAGRMSAYIGLGLLAGLAGHQLWLAGWQQALSIALGSMLLLVLIQQLMFRKQLAPQAIYRFYNGFQQLFAKYLRQPSTAGFALLGFLNGWLPCGMIYLALAASVSIGSLSGSAVLMTGFGLGTLPALLIVNFAGRLVKPGLRIYFRKAIPVMMALTAVILILRGLNLGIPYISPVLPGPVSDAIICH